MSSRTAGAHGRPGALRAQIFIGVMLFLTFIWTGSMPWLALLVTLLIAGYAYLNRHEVGRQWVALPVTFTGYWVLVLLW